MAKKTLALIDFLINIKKFFVHFFHSWTHEDKTTFCTLLGMWLSCLIMMQLKIPDDIFGGVVFGVLLAVLVGSAKSQIKVNKNEKNC